MKEHLVYWLNLKAVSNTRLLVYVCVQASLWFLVSIKITRGKVLTSYRKWSTPSSQTQKTGGSSCAPGIPKVSIKSITFYFCIIYVYYDIYQCLLFLFFILAYVLVILLHAFVVLISLNIKWRVQRQKPLKCHFKCSSKMSVFLRCRFSNFTLNGNE